MKKIIPYLLVLALSLYAQTLDEAKELFDKKEQYKEALEIFEKYQNDGEAQYYFGKAYYYGIGVEKDTKKAFEYAKKSANQNNPSGLNLLGVAYQYGEGVEKDELQALMYYKQAANLGNTKAMMNIAKMYAVGSYVKQDTNQAIGWVKKAFDIGYIDAARVLGNMYASPEVKNLAEAFKYYAYFVANSNDKGNLADTYERLGWIYIKQKDYSNAYSNYKKAADLKFYEHTYKLYDLAFENGLNDKKDEAIKYLQIASDNNDSMATQTLVQYLINDIKEPEKAVDILKKSYYEFGNIESGCSLAHHSSLGDSLSEFSTIYNPKESLKIINETTLKYPFHEKIVLCYTTLAYFYRQGNFLEKNYEKAIEIYKQIKEKYLESHTQDFVNEAINELENKDKEAKLIENNLNNKNISNENNLFTVIGNFSKGEQVATVLVSKEYYFISTSDKAIKVIDKKTLQTIRELRGYIANGVDGIVTSMAYDEKNKLLYCAGVNSTINYILNDIIKVFDNISGKIVKTIQNKKSVKNTFLNISQDGKYLVAINNNNMLNFINIETNEIQNFNLQSVNNFIFASIEQTTSDYLIHLVSTDYNFYTISHKQGKIISQEPFRNQIDIKSKTYIEQITGNKILSNFESFVPINKIFYENNDFKIELNNDKVFDFVSNHLELKSSVYNSKSNNTIFVKYLDNGSTLEILENNQKIGLINFGGQKAIYHQIIDNKYIFVANSDFTLQCFFDLNGNPLLMLDGIMFNQKDLIDSKDFLVTYGKDNIVHIWNKTVLLNSNYNEGIYDQNVLDMLSYAAGGDPTQMIKENYSAEDFIGIQKSMRLNYQLDSEKQKAYFKFFMTKKQTIYPLASLYIKNEKDWILYTPEGLFAYGGNGHKLLKYHQNQGLYKEAKIIENEKLFDKFYRPDLIKKILAGEKVDIPVDVKSVILNIKPPELKILENKMKNEKDIDLTYQICDDGNGIADPKLIINGQAINPPSSRGFSIEKIEVKDEKCKVYKSTHTLSSGENTISLKAYDKDKNIASQTEPIKVTANYKIDKKPNLYFLSIAVSDYKNDSLDLKYPVNDVLKVKEKIQQRSKSIYENIYTYELHNKDVNLENINKIFDEIKSKISKNDAFVLYMAGHGVSEDGLYQFVPYNETKKISINTIKENLSKLENDKSLVLLDTCQSGAALENTIDETATVNRLAHEDNRNYIVASSKNQVALEGLDNHGVFTYSVLDGFEKAYFADENDLLVHNLGRYIQSTVPKLTKKHFHFKQEAQFKMANDFILGGKN